MPGRMLDWLGQGDSSARPDAATMVPGKVPSGSAAIYFANDDKILSIFDESGPSWFEVDVSAVSGISFETLPDVDWSTPPTDGQVFKYNSTSGKMEPFTLAFSTEAVQDLVGAMILGGTGITPVYDDATGTVTITCSLIQYTDEQAADAIAAVISAGTHNGISIVYDDPGNGISFTVSDAYVDGRANARVNALAPAIADARIAAASINALADVDTVTLAPTNGQTMVWDSTAHLWKPGTISGGSTNWAYVPPLVSKFTDTYTGGSGGLTLTDNADEGLLVDCGSPAGTVIRGSLLATPGAVNWQVTAKIKGFVPTNNFSGYGLCVVNAAKNKMAFFNLDSRADIRLEEWAGNGFSGQPFNYNMYGADPWIRLTYTQSTGAIMLSVSPNGKIWVDIYNYANAFVGAAPAFVGLDSCYAGSPFRNVFAVPYWAQSW